MFSRSTDRKIIQLLSEIRYSEHEDSIPIIGRFLSAYLGDKDSLDLLVEEGLTYYDTVESSFLSYLKSISMYVDSWIPFSVLILFLLLFIRRVTNTENVTSAITEIIIINTINIGFLFSFSQLS